MAADLVPGVVNFFLEFLPRSLVLARPFTLRFPFDGVPILAPVSWVLGQCLAECGSIVSVCIDFGRALFKLPAAFSSTSTAVRRIVSFTFRFSCAMSFDTTTSSTTRACFVASVYLIGALIAVFSAEPHTCRFRCEVNSYDFIQLPFDLSFEEQTA
jgi:hypothetical protein